MTKSNKVVGDHMTASPETIRAGRSLADAHQLMRDLQVRHLPVLDGGRLVGVLSQGDLFLIETLKDVKPAEVPVEDAMTQNTWTTTADAPLAEVVRHMHDQKQGSAVVMKGSKVVGVFTTTDAMRVLADLLEDADRPTRARAAGG